MDNEILIDSEVKKVTDILKDPILYKIFSDEESSMIKTYYFKDLD